MHKRPCIIITRPAEDAKRTASLLDENGFDYFIEPAITIEPIPSAQIELKNTISKYDGIIITSRNALRAIANINRNIKIISLGKATTAFAKAQGFTNFQYAGKNINELCQYLKSNYNNSNLLYLSGKEITKELTADNCGNKITRLIIYRTIPLQKFSPQFKTKLKQGDFSGILFFSKKTAETFYKILKQEDLESHINHLYAVCLSENIAKFIKNYGFKATIQPKNPDILSVMELLAKLRF